MEERDPNARTFWSASDLTRWRLLRSRGRVFARFGAGTGALAAASQPRARLRSLWCSITKNRRL